MSAHDRLLAEISTALTSGDHAGALRLCRKQLRKRPGDRAVLKLLAQAQLHAGTYGEAIGTAERLLRLAPGDADTALLLGHALRLDGRDHDAREQLQRAVAAHPGDARVRHELALTLRTAGTLDEALEAFAETAALAPDEPSYRDNALLALIEAGRPQEAAARCRAALAQSGPKGDLHAILGRALVLVGDNAAARPELERALSSAPDDLAVASLLGTCLVSLGEFEPGLHLLRRCAAARAGGPVARNNLVRALVQSGRADEVVAEYRREEPTDDRALTLPALVRQLTGEDRLVQAGQLLESALAAWPGDRELEIEQARLLLRRGQTAVAAAHIQRLAADTPDDDAVLALQVRLECANGSYESAREIVEQRLRDPQRKRRLLESLLYPLNYADDCPAETLYRLHRAWAATVEPRQAVDGPPPADPDPKRRLRIGYVSPDFRDHSVAFFFEPLLDGRDRDRIEVICYANHANADDVTRRLQAKVDHWRQIERLDDARAAALVRDDGIDVLVDLAGHTRGHRLALFALRPAPVQVSAIGYVNTTGLHSIDYRLTDAICDPEDGDGPLYTETLYRLPAGHLCYRGGDVPPRPVRGGSVRAITFGSFNNVDKLSDTTLALWSRILHALPTARLLLKARKLGDAHERERLREHFASLGVDAGRLELVARLEEKRAHLRLYDEVDIALDPTPFNGVTTTCEALWMGVPVIALRGHRHVARIAASLLHHAGLPELVADDADDYVSRAVALATDRTRLDAYHADLRRTLESSHLCDVRSYAKQVEAAYRSMWHTCLGRSAEVG